MTAATSSAPVVLDVNDLVVSIGSKPDARRIIDGVSMQVRQGETLCVVGESGSGKSVTSLTVMGLLPKKVLIPTRGYSDYDHEGRVFWDVAADRAFVDGVRGSIGARVPVEELDLHVNDPDFAGAAVERLVGLMASTREAGVAMA